MKTKKLNKKLFLNRKTIANLGNIELGNVRGGAFTGGCTDQQLCSDAHVCTWWNCTKDTCTQAVDCQTQ